MRASVCACRQADACTCECLHVCGLTWRADVPNNEMMGRSPCLPGICMSAGDPDVGPYTWVASALSTESSSQTQGPNSEKFCNPIPSNSIVSWGPSVQKHEHCGEGWHFWPKLLTPSFNVRECT